MVNDEKTAAYTKNLAQMIRDVRKDLDAPTAACPQPSPSPSSSTCRTIRPKAVIGARASVL